MSSLQRPPTSLQHCCPLTGMHALPSSPAPCSDIERARTGRPRPRALTPGRIFFTIRGCSSLHWPGGCVAHNNGGLTFVSYGAAKFSVRFQCAGFDGRWAPGGATQQREMLKRRVRVWMQACFAYRRSAVTRRGGSRSGHSRGQTASIPLVSRPSCCVAQAGSESCFLRLCCKLYLLPRLGMVDCRLWALDSKVAAPARLAGGLGVCKNGGGSITLFSAPLFLPLRLASCSRRGSRIPVNTPVS